MLKPKTPEVCPDPKCKSRDIRKEYAKDPTGPIQWVVWCAKCGKEIKIGEKK